MKDKQDYENIFNEIINTDMYKVIKEIDEAINDGILNRDPDNFNNILVYCAQGTNSPAGWYSENIIRVASELVNDKEQYKEFHECIQNAREEAKEWFDLVDMIKTIIEPLKWKIASISPNSCVLKFDDHEILDFSFYVGRVNNLDDFIESIYRNAWDMDLRLVNDNGIRENPKRGKEAIDELCNKLKEVRE